MTDQSAWHEGNSRYLSAALACLRARLKRLATQYQEPLVAPQPASAPVPPTTAVHEESRLSWRRFRRVDVASSPALLVPPAPATEPDPSRGSAEITLAQAEAELAAASKLTPPPALVSLAQLLGLSPFERDVLLLCMAMEFDTGIAALCARAQGEPSRPFPTFALALMLFDAPAWDALSPEHGLRYWRLIEVHQTGAAQPLTTSPLRADERIVNFAKGLNYLDDRLSPLLSGFEPADAAALPPSQQETVDRITHQLTTVAAGRRLPVIELLGPDSESKRLVAAQVARSLNLALYRVPASLLPSDPADLENLARLCRRESLLLQTALYVDSGAGSDMSAPGNASAISRFVTRLDGVVFVDGRDRSSSLPEGSLSLDVVSPTPAEQSSAWRSALEDQAGEAPGLLAGQFSLSSAAIHRIAKQALAEKDEAPLVERLWRACLEVTRPQLDMLAQRLDPKANWEDLVLPASTTNLLHQISAQVAQRSRVYQEWGFGDKMSRGFGISALFAGDSGTGKTMAAEVIANELRLNLYRIDLSAVVSKYIGETEKNLRRLFDAAEQGGAILFFDEADALFGKRSEVKDSHDRYANIEINYLLQRMEAYRGLAILATNMKSALDQAFLRRLRFVVDFPFPSVEQRKRIWQQVFPPNTPLSAIDFDMLARLNLTGGNIQSIALNAAFTAAGAREKLTNAMLLEAARTEMRKLGRVVNELEFRRHTKAGVA